MVAGQLVLAGIWSASFGSKTAGGMRSAGKRVSSGKAGMLQAGRRWQYSSTLLACFVLPQNFDTLKREAGQAVEDTFEKVTQSARCGIGAARSPQLRRRGMHRHRHMHCSVPWQPWGNRCIEQSRHGLSAPRAVNAPLSLLRPCIYHAHAHVLLLQCRRG